MPLGLEPCDASIIKTSKTIVQHSISIISSCRMETGAQGVLQP
jgi:hypothetical protein